MIVTIHQPEHLPWLGFFNKLFKAECFVVLDNVQFKKNSFQNRNKILGSSGEQWIGVPVLTKGHIENDIAHTFIASQSNPKWKQKYLQTVKMSYGKYTYFDEVYPILEDVFSMETDKLYDINIRIIKEFSKKLGISSRFICASELNAEGSKSNLVLDICKKVGAKTYISGSGGRDYMNMQSFRDANIAVVFNDYIHPQYPQRRTDRFVANLSSLDLFMNCGFEKGKEIILEGNEGVNPF